MQPKVRQGMVVSDKMKKTVVVAVERVFRHSLYQKVISVRKKYKAQVEEGVCKVGDLVEIVSTRPLSRQKRWRVLRVIKK